MSYQKFLQKLAESDLREHLAPGVYDQILEGFASANPLQIRQAIRFLDRYILTQTSDRQKFLNNLSILAQDLEKKVTEAEHQLPFQQLKKQEIADARADQQKLNKLNTLLK
ncbi:MAG: hypothetical protein ACRCZE_00440 [Candidatus Altimarinota bacterium]